MADKAGRRFLIGELGGDPESLDLSYLTDPSCVMEFHGFSSPFFATVPGDKCIFKTDF